MGTQWCARVPNPVGVVINPPGMPEINEPMGGGDPEGCLCADQETHMTLTSLLDNGEAIVTEDEIENSCPAFAFRQAVYIAARDRCEEIAENEMNPTPDDYTACTNNIDQDEEDMSDPLVTPLYQNGTPGSCFVGIDYGGVACSWEGPGDTWSDYYSLSSQIVFSAGAYWIKDAFYWDVLENPAWLLTDGTKVVDQGGHWRFVGCNQGTICYALGIRNNDEPLTISSMPLNDFDDLLAAYAALRNGGLWALVLKRGTNNVTLTYKRWL